jgi:hypothetical protein
LENEILVLGGGITGLTAGYLLNVPVITTKIGGQASNPFPLGPRYIHSTPETKIFVQSLGLNTDTRKIKVGYFYNNSYHEKLPKNLIKEYSLKTRGITNTSTSITEGSFEALYITFNNIIKKLSEKVEIIEDRIYRINRNTLYGMRKNYRFKKLISTIPLPKLYSLYGLSSLFRYIPIGYCYSTLDESFFFAETFRDFDYVYFPERKYPYYRVTKVVGGFVYEFTYNYENKYPREIIWQEFGKILPSSNIRPPRNNVILLGRFGKWKDNYLFQDVLKDILLLASEKAVQDVQAVQR